MLAADCPQKLLTEQVTELLTAEKPFDAARLVGKFLNDSRVAAGEKPMDVPCDTKPQAYTLLGILLQWLLDNDGFEEAALLLWGPTQFDPRPDSTRRVWRAFENHNNILLMGAGSMSKSFSMAIKLFLEWIRDPEHTTVKVLGPSEQHLEDNLFSHLVRLHKSSRIPLPGTVGKLFIGLDSRARKSSIIGVVIPLGKKAAGRLQGNKRDRRAKPHPKFGNMTRLFIFLDEIANIPGGIWRDIENLLSNTNGDGLKIVGAFNPTDQNDAVGQRCEPTFGWPSFDADEHFEWKSTRGWFVVRLDAKYCENVVAKQVLYDGLQTYEGYNLIIQSSGGLDSPGYWAMARGCFPPMGTVMSIIAPGLLDKWKAEPIWYDRPRPCAGVDLALEGGDSAQFAKGLFGQASGVKLPPTVSKPEGETIHFKDARGRLRPRYILFLEAIFPLPKAETVAMTDEVMRVGRAAMIEPEWCCVDRTGNGAGVHDLLKHNWGGGGCQGVNFSESAVEAKIMVEDSGTAYELYDRIQSELWFAVRKFIEFGYFYCSPALDTTELVPQLTGRLFRMSGKKSKVESKPDYKSRNGNKSPDKADGVSLLLNGVRRTSGFIPGMAPDNSSEPDLGDEDDYRGRSGDLTDVTNRFDDLDNDSLRES